MSDASNFALPTAEEMLVRGTLIKPLQHDVAALTQFIAQFEHVALKPEAAEQLANLSHYMQQPEWAAAHDVAHHALMKAAAMVKTMPELAKEAYIVNAWVNARLPDVASLQMLKHAGLKDVLAPVGDYAKAREGFLRGWMPLTSSYLKPTEGAGTTLAQFRAATPHATSHFANPEGPKVHPRATTASKPRSAKPLGGTDALNMGHVHGPDCGHTAEEVGRASIAFGEALPKGVSTKWIVAGAGATAVGAVLINALGKSGAGDTHRAHEKEKGEDEKAGDIAYTINHALSCGTTDVVLQPVIAAAFGVHVGCVDPGHNHGPQTLTIKRFAQEAAHYFKGEIIGDFVAVPLTIGVQRLFPNFMHGLRTLLEPAFGWAFRRGADHAAQRWAQKEGLAADAPEVKARAADIYEHEVAHLPQAAVWNMFAYPIGAVAQKVTGHGQSYPQIFKSKLVGALVSNTLLIGGRMIAPGAAEKWDTYTGDKLFMPMSRTVGKVFGVDHKTMENAVRRQKDGVDGAWQERVRMEEALAPAVERKGF